MSTPAGASTGAPATHPAGDDPVAGTTLRVCGDPGNMPLSNRAGEGFQNRIAEVLGEAMGMPVEYHWHTYYQRGLARTTINAGRCDVLMDMSTDFEMGLTTRPVYRSTYVLVSGQDLALKPKTLDDPALKGIRIGMFQSSQARQALHDHGVMPAEVQYLFYDSNTAPEEHPAKLVEMVAAGKLDAAEAWGPTAGYYAKRDGLTLHPLNTIDDEVLEYSVALAVARKNPELRDRLDVALEQSRDRIRAVLDEFGVPLVECTDCIVSGPLPSHGPYAAPTQTHIGPVSSPATVAALRERLAEGADPSGELLYAITGDDLGRVEHLLAAGATTTVVDRQGENALHLAIRGRQPDILARVLAAGADVEAGNASGWTPLMRAVWLEDMAAVDALLAKGAAADAVAKDGWAPLSLATTYGNAAMVRRLLDAGADPDRANPSGFTAVMFAVSKDEPALLDALIARGADVDLANPDGVTPLMLAAAAGRAALVERLVKAGANPSARDTKGRTAEALARESGHAALATTLATPRPSRQ